MLDSVVVIADGFVIIVVVKVGRYTITVAIVVGVDTVLALVPDTIVVAVCFVDVGGAILIRIASASGIIGFCVFSQFDDIGYAIGVGIN